MRQTRTVSLDTLEYLYIPDVTYATYGETQRKMQLIIPYRPQWQNGETVPMIAFLPGSAWYQQEMYNGIPALAKLAERGFAVASVQYRESKIAPFPAQVEDVHRAIHYIAEQLAKLFHIDMARTFLMGNSSGGHIALLTALRQAAGIADVLELLNFPIRGVIAESAPSDLFLCAKEGVPANMPATFHPTADLLGVSCLQEHPEKLAEASAQTYLAPGHAVPPILLLHGDSDAQVNVAHSRTLYERLTQNGADADYIELAGVNHGGAPFWTEDVLQIIADFIHKHC